MKSFGGASSWPLLMAVQAPGKTTVPHFWNSSGYQPAAYQSQAGFHAEVKAPFQTVRSTLVVWMSSAWVSPPFPRPPHPALIPYLLNFGNWTPVLRAGQHHKLPGLIFLSVLESSLAKLFFHPTYQANQTWSWVRGRRVISAKSVWTPAGRIQITLLNACLCSSLNSELYKDRDCLYFGSLAPDVLWKDSVKWKRSYFSILVRLNSLHNSFQAGIAPITTFCFLSIEEY